MMQLTHLPLPSKQPPGLRPLPTYVRHLIATKRQARAVWQRTQYPSDKRHYNNLPQKLKRTLSEIRTENYNKHLSSLTTKDNSIWKTTKNILRTPPVKEGIKSDADRLFTRSVTSPSSAYAECPMWYMEKVSNT
jgi:hypothetical protein